MLKSKRKEFLSLDFFFENYFVDGSYGKCLAGNDNIMRMFGDSSLHSNSLRDDVHQVLLLDAWCHDLFCVFLGV
jgi:hypothetical protein